MNLDENLLVMMMVITTRCSCFNNGSSLAGQEGRKEGRKGLIDVVCLVCGLFTWLLCGVSVSHAQLHCVAIDRAPCL